MPNLFLIRTEPRPNVLNPDTGWAKPRIYRSKGRWVCEVQAYLYHGDKVVVTGTHEDLNWAWSLLVDHLVRHGVVATYEQTTKSLGDGNG